MPDTLFELREEIAALLPRLRRFGRTLAHARTRLAPTTGRDALSAEQEKAARDAGWR